MGRNQSIVANRPKAIQVKIELIYIENCANYAEFAIHLDELTRSQGIACDVHPTLVTSVDQARQLRFLGSPTLRVNGIDVDPSALERTDYGLQCRLYRTEDGHRGTPPDDWILVAINQHQT